MSNYGNQEPPLFSNQRREQYLEKPLPSSDDSERVCLGAVLLDPEIITTLIGKVHPEDFYSPFNRKVFSAMIALFERQVKIDPILIGEELKREGNLESIGGVTAIANLTFGLPHFTNVAEYVEIIRDKSTARKAMRVMNAATTEILSEEDDIYDSIQRVAAKMTDLSEVKEEEDFDDSHDLIEKQIQLAHMVQDSGNPVTGLPSGFIDMDAYTAGWQRTDLIILAGRPSMGKTALGLTLAQNAAFRQDALVALFSLEMSKAQLVNRIICSEAGVNQQNFRTGILTDDDWEKIAEARQFMASGRLWIDDTPAISSSVLRHRAKRLERRHKRPLDLIVIDYLQLMSGPVGMRFENRQQEVSRISRELKQIAKWLDCPVIALSQLSRAPENRANHKPLMSDLRESGSIEQDADVVAFIYRESEYPLQDGTIVGEGEADVIFSKQRNGPTGPVKLMFNKSTGRFLDYSSEF